MRAPANTNNLRVLTAEYMVSTTTGLGVRRNWLPRPVSQAFLQSTRDGTIQISPDPVTMISGTMNWFNSTPDPQELWVAVHRAPRAITAQNPTTIIITDGWSWQMGINPIAVTPSVTNDTFGGRLQIDRPETFPANLKYARYFLEGDDTTTYVPIGVLPSHQYFVFSYMAGVQTPGVWTQPTNFQGQYSASAYWTRLITLAAPVGSS